MKKDKRFVISFMFNILVFLLVLIGTIVMMTIGSGALAENSLSVFKYFTFQSNIFMGVISAIYAFYQWLILKGKKDKIPHVLTILNLVGTSAVALTFIIVIAFLGPGYGYDKMYNNANLFFHLLAPVTAIINYLFFTRNEKYHFIQTLFTIIPCFLYGLVYFIVVASLNGYGDLKIDFYNFGKGGPLIGAFNYLMVMVIAYIIALFLYFLNRLIFRKEK